MNQKILILTVFFLLCNIATPLQASHEITFDESENGEVVLLRNEHYLYLEAQEPIDQTTVDFVFPPLYQYQVPFYLELFNDTSEKLVSYHIENHTYHPNKIISFTIEPLDKDEKILLHFTCWVLVQSHSFSDLPQTVDFEDYHLLPASTTIWLTQTPVVQKENIFIKAKARQLRGFSNNVLDYAEKIAWFIKYHRYPLFILQLNTGLFLSQDALTTLFINGENIGRSHLACALFRTFNIPARVLLAHNDQGFLTQMHYMVEYYVPHYGWVLLDPTKGETPYTTQRQIINRYCYPSDENDTKQDYILPFMKGEERWLWTDTDAIQPYYKDCDEGSKSQMFPEGAIQDSYWNISLAMALSAYVFNDYQKYLGMNLSGINAQYFTNATYHQRLALEAFQQEQLETYRSHVHHAYTNYSAIEL